MPTLSLTDRGVHSLRVGIEAQRTDYRDEGVRGLVLRVTPAGVKTYSVWFRINGKARRYTLGRVGALSLVDARQQAREILAAVGRGEDPVASKKQRRVEAMQRDLRGDTFETLARRCLEAIGPGLRPRSLAEYRRALEVDAFPKIGKVPPEAIQRGDIRALVKEKATTAPVQANRTLAAIRRVLNWAVAEDILSVSPCLGLKAPMGERPRQRTHSDNEIRRLFVAAQGTQYSLLLPLLFYTGTRSEETRSARWDEIDLERKLWTIPSEKAKTREASPLPHPVPLSGGALRLLREIPKGASPWLFPGVRSEGGFLPHNQKAIAVLRESSTVADFRFHDVRRTVASRLAGMGVPPHVVDAILGHKPPRLVRTYQVYSYEREMRAALEAWGRALDRMVTVRGRSA